MEYNQYSHVIAFDSLADPDETWNLGKKIGEGTYGEVYAAMHKHTGMFACGYMHNVVIRCGYIENYICVLVVTDQQLYNSTFIF